MKNDYSPGSGKQNICSWKCARDALQVLHKRNRHGRPCPISMHQQKLYSMLYYMVYSIYRANECQTYFTFLNL